VDASALIALLHPRERHHDEVVELERRIRRLYRRWVLPELFLAELHAFGTRRVGRQRADAGVRQLLLSTRVELVFGSPELHLATLDLLRQRPDLPLSYADAAGLAVARARDITDALTLDSRWAACGVTVIS
jgi:predicted nucleic acid-binding protein